MTNVFIDWLCYQTILDENHGSLLYEILHEHIQNPKYGSDFGDLVPIIIYKVRGIDFIIIEDSNIFYIEPDNTPVIIHKISEHYNGIVLQ